MFNNSPRIEKRETKTVQKVKNTVEWFSRKYKIQRGWNCKKGESKISKLQLVYLEVRKGTKCIFPFSLSAHIHMVTLGKNVL